MMTPTMTPMMFPMEPLVSTANSGCGGGATLATVGGVTTASTAIETPVTLANINVALLGLLVAVAIVDWHLRGIHQEWTSLLGPKGSGLLFFMFIRTHPYNTCWWDIEICQCGPRRAPTRGRGVGPA